jgi:hypothetical protein
LVAENGRFVDQLARGLLPPEKPPCTHTISGRAMFRYRSEIQPQRDGGAGVSWRCRTRCRWWLPYQHQVAVAQRRSRAAAAEAGWCPWSVVEVLVVAATHEPRRRPRHLEERASSFFNAAAGELHATMNRRRRS